MNKEGEEVEQSKTTGNKLQPEQSAMAEETPVPKTEEQSPSNDPAPITSPIAEPNEDKKQDMEVHHHSHAGHGKKNWKSYFWEFLMLFLAVFCGFFAEYQLEHKIERDRAKELAKSFYEELKNDSVSIAEKYQNRLKLENSIQYLMKYFKDSSTGNLSKNFVINFHYGAVFRSPAFFEPRTVVLEQLKNSGSLRYFKNDELQKLIGDISVAIYNVNDRQTVESGYRESHITPLLIKHYDVSFESATIQFGGKNLFENLLEYEKRDTIILFSLKKAEIFDGDGAGNILGFFAILCRGTRTIHFEKYIEVNAELLKLLRKEYRLK